MGALVIVLVIAMFLLPPHWLFSLASWVAPRAIYFGETSEPVIALTIDDGPNATTTPEILATLARYQVKATFFSISSNIAGNESLMLETVRQGHELGNHMIEDRASIRLSSEEFTTSLLQAKEALGQFAETRWFRPGMGWYNSEMIAIAAQHNYKTVLGSVFPYDTHLPFPWFASQFILANVRPGAIIVLHDGEGRGKRAAMTLHKVIPKLQSQGYQFVTLSQLLTK